jgi:anaerobic selenocysteine-containing dehydrogenase
VADERSKLSRRSFLKRTAAGAAAAAALAAAPSMLVVAEKGGGGTATEVTTPLVAYIRDVSKGEVVVMMGTREVVRRDPNLARWLASIGQGA